MKIKIDIRFLSWNQKLLEFIFGFLKLNCLLQFWGQTICKEKGRVTAESKRCSDNKAAN
ncbi:hypothetical protein JCM15457_1336 [Liquorilactobacillus sucicola DSM 21376 = JCM 15457]|uniref:Uncharacterized protein n=1 Tax=Liquorilactobacillus sucicola DSM 21376 = JCM 15457 TaxID=1423806 RepID=A0A023CWY8_9LACO|nr:hypothetical protein [Liquorilactobacillus sucicola]KRN06929.1 hypothetical protein FD15_GL000492 [Liquorilactobacillus sucicola DSM 21376 = JCM 15457]GAJ26408.1 hypothetical protein JCM15457_1336 [Liquorilactobacillus sucicola DSM 21376 = JCM 15457]